MVPRRGREGHTRPRVSPFSSVRSGRGSSPFSAEGGGETRGGLEQVAVEFGEIAEARDQAVRPQLRLGHVHGDFGFGGHPLRPGVDRRVEVGDRNGAVYGAPGGRLSGAEAITEQDRFARACGAEFVDQAGRRTPGERDSVFASVGVTF